MLKKYIPYILATVIVFSTVYYNYTVQLNYKDKLDSIKPEATPSVTVVPKTVQDIKKSYPQMTVIPTELNNDMKENKIVAKGNPMATRYLTESDAIKYVKEIVKTTLSDNEISSLVKSELINATGEYDKDLNVLNTAISTFISNKETTKTDLSKAPDIKYLDNIVNKEAK